MKDDEHLFYFALARTQYLTGKTVAAEISLDRARALAPENRLADYTRPLHELVEEEYGGNLVTRHLRATCRGGGQQVNRPTNPFKGLVTAVGNKLPTLRRNATRAKQFHGRQMIHVVVF